MARNFFLVDDDKIWGFVVSKLLEYVKADASVKQFSDGRSLLQWFKQQHASVHLHPDCILLDIKMPGMDAWQFLQQWSREGFSRHGIPVYIVTASERQEDLELSVNFPEVKGYFVKPLKKEDVYRIIASVESLKQLQR